MEYEVRRSRKIYPYEYRTTADYKEKVINFEFWIMSLLPFTILIAVLSFATTSLPSEVSTKDTLIAITGMVFMLLSAIGLIHNFVSAHYGFTDFIDELRIRKKFKKHDNYTPLEKEALEALNDIVKLKDGRLYRRYHFINVEKSDVDYVLIELPDNVESVSKNISKYASDEEMCMFDALSEADMLDILLPIKAYYEDKLHQSQLEQKRIKENEKQKEIYQQSEINQKVTKQDVRNLPLLKSLKSINNKAKRDISQYQEDIRENAEQNQSIIDEIKKGS